MYFIEIIFWLYLLFHFLAKLLDSIRELNVQDQPAHGLKPPADQPGASVLLQNQSFVFRHHLQQDSTNYYASALTFISVLDSQKGIWPQSELLNLLCLFVALAGLPSSGESLYGDRSDPDELVNLPYQIPATVSLNDHSGPALLQCQRRHGAPIWRKGKTQF